MQINDYADFILMISLINLGLFGGFSHCISMCGPFVLTQVSNRLSNASIEDYSGLKKLQNLALFPYHFGRIVTYSLIGFLCSLLSKNIGDFANFRKFSAILMIFAAILFLQKALEKKFWPKNWIFNLRFKFDLNFLRKLFQNPTGYRGFLLGVILGFIPCGLLYGAFAIAATIKVALIAGLSMFLFGVMTAIPLVLSAFGGYVFFKNLESYFKVVARLVILINSATLFLMAINLLIN